MKIKKYKMGISLTGLTPICSIENLRNETLDY
jgi:hypothetical protein